MESSYTKGVKPGQRRSHRPAGRVGSLLPGLLPGKDGLLIKSPCFLRCRNDISLRKGLCTFSPLWCTTVSLLMCAFERMLLLCCLAHLTPTRRFLHSLSLGWNTLSLTPPPAYGQPSTPPPKTAESPSERSMTCRSAACVMAKLGQGVAQGTVNWAAKGSGITRPPMSRRRVANPGVKNLCAVAHVSSRQGI